MYCERTVWGLTLTSTILTLREYDLGAAAAARLAPATLIIHIFGVGKEVPFEAFVDSTP